MACACLTHRKLPCLFGTVDGDGWNKYDHCHSLLQRFDGIVHDR
jgi:hypothetical protein